MFCNMRCYYASSSVRILGIKLDKKVLLGITHPMMILHMLISALKVKYVCEIHNLTDLDMKIRYLKCKKDVSFYSLVHEDISKNENIFHQRHYSVVKLVLSVHYWHKISSHHDQRFSRSLKFSSNQIYETSKSHQLLFPWGNLYREAVGGSWDWILHKLSTYIACKNLSDQHNLCEITTGRNFSTDMFCGIRIFASMTLSLNSNHIQFKNATYSWIESSVEPQNVGCNNALLQYHLINDNY